MKPYRKTYRASKIHKAKECGICAEEVDRSPSPIRQEAKRSIENGELEADCDLQSEHNETEDQYQYFSNY